MKKIIGSKSRILISIVFLIANLSILTSCSKSSDHYTPAPGPQGTPVANEVLIQNLAFSPSTITVPAGTTIKWTNKEGVSHTVTSNVGSAESFDSGSMANGATFTWKFNTAGSFNYHCTLHAGMNATVVVN